MTGILPSNSNSGSVPLDMVASPPKEFHEEVYDLVANLEPELWWVVILILAFVLVCLFKLIPAYLVPTEKSGLAFLKQELKKQRVDLSLIPEIALKDLVSNCIKASQAIAAARVLSDRKGTISANPRANLVRQLRATARIVQVVMEGGHVEGIDNEVRAILSRYINVP